MGLEMVSKIPRNKNVPRKMDQPQLRRMGKAQAREEFSPLVESLATEGGVIEITDYGKVAAVMLGYKDYMFLVAKANAEFKPKMRLRGSAILIGDLEEATKEISETVMKSIEKTIAEI